MQGGKWVLAVVAAGSMLALSAGVVFAGETAELWNKKCAICHGKDGKGDTKIGRKKGVKDLTDPAVRAKFDRDRMIKHTTEGIPDEDGDGFRMKGFAEKLSADEIAALVDYAISLGK